VGLGLCKEGRPHSPDPWIWPSKSRTACCSLELGARGPCGGGGGGGVRDGAGAVGLGAAGVRFLGKAFPTAGASWLLVLSVAEGPQYNTITSHHITSHHITAHHSTAHSTHLHRPWPPRQHIRGNNVHHLANSRVGQRDLQVACAWCV